MASLVIVSQLCCGLSFQLRTGLVPHGVMRVRLVPDGVTEMPSRPPARIRVMVQNTCEARGNRRIWFDFY